MKFINSTPYPARFTTGSSGQKEIIGVTACKVTYQVQNEILLPVTGEEAWPVFDKPYVFEGIPLAPETDFRKKGTDLLIFGSAVTPDDFPVVSMQVAVSCGKINHRTTVFGDRVWEKGPGGFRPTPPKPFTSMPLTNNRTFGGSAKLQDSEVVHAVNPEGRGFLLEENRVEGTRLPNIEDPDHLITQWTDTPRPACWFKPAGFLQAKSAREISPETLPLTMMQSLFNQSVPELSAAPEKLGKTLRLVGFSKDGDILFPIPEIRGPIVDVRVGTIKDEFPTILSTVIVLPGEKIIIATYTVLFRYLMQPFEKRSVRLYWPGHSRRERPEKKEKTDV